MAFLFILGSNIDLIRCPEVLVKNFAPPGVHGGGGEHRVPNLGSQSANYSCYLLNTNLTTIMHDSMIS